MMVSLSLSPSQCSLICSATYPSTLWCWNFETCAFQWITFWWILQSVIWWLVSHVPFWPAFLYLKYDQNSGGCVPFWPTPNFIKYQSVINGQIFFAVPALIMGVLYTLLIYQLWFKRKTSTTSVAQRAVLKHRCRFAKMVITVSLIYCICWFPNCFVYIYVAYSTKQLFGAIHTASVLMVSLNSAVNPVIYSLQSHRFRRHLAALIKRYRCNKVIDHDHGGESNTVLWKAYVM